MAISVNKLAFACLSLALVVCGGGGGVGGPQYYDLLNNTAAATSDITGSTLNSSSTAGTINVVDVTGSIRHDTGQTDVSDGRYTLIDPNGFDAGNDLRDGISIINGGVTYDYATMYTQNYMSGGNNYDNIGVFGIGTRISDVPTGGQAVYTGQSSLGYATTFSNGFGATGTARVTADFAAGEVDVDMTNFTNGGSSVTFGGADRVQITGMTITGNRFADGFISATANGQANNSTTFGTGITGRARGNFFGYDSTISAPDEVGGAFYASGSNGALVGTFIAD
jgi:hypothetical protein